MSTFVFSFQHKDAEYRSLVVGVIDSDWRRCNANVPCHLPNKLEYKFLGCISVHCQSRMASNGRNGIVSTPSHPSTVQAGQNMGVGGGGGLQCRRSILVILWMSLHVGIVPCVSNFVELWSGACLRVLVPMCMDSLTYGTGGKKVVNNGTEWFERF